MQELNAARQMDMNNEKEEVSIKDIVEKIRYWFAYMHARWILIFLAIILGAGAGFIYSKYKKPIYTAELNFVLEDEKSGGLGAAAGLASQLGVDLGGTTSGAFSGDNLLELLKSRSMVEKTLLSEVMVSGKTETLAELYISFNTLRSKWKKEEGLEGLAYPTGANRKTFSLKQDSMLGQFYKQILKNILTIDKIDKKLSIISVIVNSQNEMFSKTFCEKLVNNVSNFYIETKTKKEAENVAILQHQTDSVIRQLNSGITRVASAMDINPNPNPSLQILRAPSQRSQVGVQANTAILTELVRNLELSKITLRKETPLIQVIDSPILPLEKTRLSALKGIVLGAFLAGFLTILFFSLKLVYIKITT